MAKLMQQQPDDLLNEEQDDEESNSGANGGSSDPTDDENDQEIEKEWAIPSVPGASSASVPPPPGSGAVPVIPGKNGDIPTGIDNGMGDRNALRKKLYEDIQKKNGS